MIGSPSPTGAIAGGLDYQIRFFWVHALRMLERDSNIDMVELEGVNVKGFDDVVVHYRGLGAYEPASGQTFQRDYYQCKFKTTMGSYGLYDLSKYVLELAKKNWFREWKKLYCAWVRDGMTPMQECHLRKDLREIVNPLPYRVYLITNWGLSTNIPIGFSAHNGAIKASQLDDRLIVKLQEHLLGLGISDDDKNAFKAFVQAFRFDDYNVGRINEKIGAACQKLGLFFDNDRLDYNRLVSIGQSFLRNGQRRFDANTLWHILKANNMEIPLNSSTYYPVPRQEPLPRRSFDGLKRKYKDIDIELLGSCFRRAFKAVYPSSRLADVFPGLQTGIDWDLLDDYFSRKQFCKSFNQDRWTQLIGELRNELGSPSECSSARLPLISFIFRGDERAPGSYQCFAAIQGEEGGYEKVRLPRVTVDYPGKDPCRDSVQARSIDVGSGDSIPGILLYQWLGKVVQYLHANAMAPFDCDGCCLDLYLPLDLLDMDWMPVSRIDSFLEDALAPEPLECVRYRFRSYDRWANPDLVQFRRFLKEKWIHHNKGNDAYALVLNQEADQSGLFNRVKQSSFVAIYAKVKASREHVRRWRRHFVRAFVPIVAWWHHDCAAKPDSIEFISENEFFPPPLVPRFICDSSGVSAERVFSLNPARVVEMQHQHWPRLIVLYEDFLEPCESQSGCSVLVEPKLFHVALGGHFQGREGWC